MYETSIREKKIRPSKRKRLNRSTGGTLAIFIVLGFFGLFSAMPLYLTIINAFKPLNELWVYPPKFYIINPTLENFSQLMTTLGNSSVVFGRYVFNTVLITVVGTIGQIVFGSMGAYAISKVRFPGHKIYFQIIVKSLMFTTAVTSIPSYLIMSKLGFIDTYWAVLLPACGGTLGLFLMKQFMDQISDTLMEAARIDGAGEFGIYWRIVMPNAKHAWLTVIVFSVQGLWNAGASPYIYTEEFKSLNYALGQITAAGIARAGVAAAISVLIMAVPITIFLITQSNIIETMSTSGMKD